MKDIETKKKHEFTQFEKRLIKNLLFAIALILFTSCAVFLPIIFGIFNFSVAKGIVILLVTFFASIIAFVVGITLEKTGW